MKFAHRAFLSSLTLAALIGCQANPPAPTEGDAQSVWHHIAEQNRVGDVSELVSLKKTNGQMQEVNGMKVYTLFYEAKIRYRTQVGHWKPGDVQTLDSNYGFQSTEKGWQGPDGTIYSK